MIEKPLYFLIAKTKILNHLSIKILSFSLIISKYILLKPEKYSFFMKEFYHQNQQNKNDEV